jgi:hypothetical protein
MSPTLTYDTLPAHSRLRRDFESGMLKLTASAEEPGPLVKRAALLRAAVPAAWICFAVLLVGLAMFGATYQAHRRLMPAALSIVLLGAYVTFCAALFALVWRAQYSARIDAAGKALQQNTLIAAAPGRIIVETAGPMGQASHELVGHIRGLGLGHCDDLHRLDCLQIVMDDGTSIRIFAGRDEAELKWVARTLTSVVSGPEDAQRDG